MITRRTLETAGLFTIAAALHVSAAAIMLPERLERGVAAEAPPAALAAGGEEIRSMVTEWEAPPEIAATPEIAEPQTPPEVAAETDPMPQPAPDQPMPDQPVMAAAPDLMMPEPTPAQPNLPEPPEPIAPEPDPEPIDPSRLTLPALQQMPPPEVAPAPEPEPALTLTASARPDRRPEPQPEPEPEPRRAPAPEPQRQQAAPADAPARQAPPAQRAGEGGQSQTTRTAGGGGGASAATQASAMSQWGAQIGSCISRRAAAPRGVRQGGRVILSLTIANGGTIQAVGLAGSSGQPQLDQAALTAAQRVGRCPGAPRELTDATYSFQLPIIINVR